MKHLSKLGCHSIARLSADMTSRKADGMPFELPSLRTPHQDHSGLIYTQIEYKSCRVGQFNREVSCHMMRHSTMEATGLEEHKIMA